MGDADETQWSRPAVQPQDVEGLLAAPLSVARGTHSGTAGSVSSQQQLFHHDQDQRINLNLKHASHKPKKQSSHKPSLHHGGLSGAHQHQQQEKQYFAKHPLLVKRVWRMKEYIADLRNRPKGLKKYVPGEPIPVPLEYGQKFRDYEQRFVEWLASKSVTLHDLRDDVLRERSYRISFAEKCVLNNPHKQTSPAPRLEVVVASDAPVLLAAASSKQKRDRSESPPPAMNRKRSARVVSKENDRWSEYGEPPRKIHLKRGPPSPARSSSSASSQYTQSDLLPLPPKPESAPRPVLTTHRTPAPAAVGDTAATGTAASQGGEKCTAKLPGAKASNEAFVAVYANCNCRQCMQDWNLMLTERLTALEAEMRSWREQQQELLQVKTEDSRTSGVTEEGAVRQMENGVKMKPRDAPETSNSVLTAESKALKASRAEETSDTEDTCSTISGTEPSSSKAEPTRAAATKPLPATANGSKSGAHSNTIGTLAGDPIKTCMVEEYNALNSQILLNEKVMEDSLQRVQANMLTDMAGAVQERQQIQQIQQIQQLIQSDVESRNKALAILIAYCWAYKQQDLRDQIDRLGALNIAHVHGVSHGKCADLAVQIENKHEFLASLKETLDQIISDGSFTDSSIEELSALGKQISIEEQALATLEQARMDEFMRLFQFSLEIRTSCKAVLEGGK